MRSAIEVLQPVGRALMLPIAVLPIAGLLLRFGQPDLLNLSFIAAAGDAVFSNLGLLFAIGVAVGLAKDNNGAAGLAGAVCFLIASKGALHPIAAPPGLFAGVPDTLQPVVLAAYKAKAIAKLYVPMGIISGLIGGNFYNRFHQLKLPDYLAFFAGRRFVPIAAGLAGLVLAGIFGGAFEYLDHGIDSISRVILGLGPIGLILYGIANRLLIITGLHHIINNLAWFILGDYHGATGDLNRFFAGDPSAGVFMAGFFPVMMFGLPAACLAMYHTALPERRKAVGGMLLSMALTALLTGVTEPIEFAFMFLAPVLFALHAVLTGIAFVIMDVLGVRLGFSFSAGLFDYVINFKLATRPLLLIPVGLVYFGLYYGLFRLFIQKLDLKTPGREAIMTSATSAAALQASSRGEGFVLALGGAGNLASVDACTTRLRLIVNDQAKVDEAALRALGAKGMVRPSDKALQVVLGPIADQVAGEIRTVWSAPAGAPAAVVEKTGSVPAVTALDASRLLAALGGKGNVADVLARSSRLLVTVRDGAQIAEVELGKIAPRGVVRISPTSWQIIVGEEAEGLALGLAGVTSPTATDIAGLILAGGRATRMSGRNKAEIELGGQTLLARTIARAKPQVGRLLLNANRDPAIFGRYGLPVLKDTIGDHWGPLAGILAGLEHLAATWPQIKWMASFPTDSPFFPTDLVARLAEAVEGHDLVMATGHGQPEPVFSLWPVHLAGELRAALSTGLRKVEDFARSHRLATVDWPADAFFNVNSPDDLQQASRRL